MKFWADLVLDPRFSDLVALQTKALLHFGVLFQTTQCDRLSQQQLHFLLPVSVVMGFQDTLDKLYFIFFI